MIEKGIVLKISSGRAYIRLDAGSLSPDTAFQDTLEAHIPQEILLHAGDNVMVLLSPGHSLKLRPWELAVSILILAGVSLAFHTAYASILAHLFLFFCFLKIRARRILFSPKVMGICR